MPQCQEACEALWRGQLQSQRGQQPGPEEIGLLKSWRFLGSSLHYTPTQSLQEGIAQYSPGARPLTLNPVFAL